MSLRKRILLIGGVLLILGIPVVLAAVPTHDNPVLSSSGGNDTTDEDLTLTEQNVNDSDLDTVRMVSDWRVDGTSMAVLNMPFEITGSESSTAKDYSDDGYDGTLGGTVPTFNSSGGNDGRGAYTFTEASNQRIAISDNDDLDGFTEMTIAFWINADSMASWNGIVAKCTSDACSSGGGAWAVSRQGSAGGDQDKIRFLVYNSGGSGDAFYSAETLTAGYVGAWHHVAITWDGATKTATFYKDGVAETPIVGSNVSQIRNSTHPVWIGEAFATSSAFDGEIDEVLLFDRALSAEQVANLANNDWNLMDSNETDIGEDWQGCMTPNDGTEGDGLEKCSNTLSIISSLSIPEFSVYVLAAVLIIGVGLSYGKFGKVGKKIS